MGIGTIASLIDIRSNYQNKLAYFYSSHSHQEKYNLRLLWLNDWRDENNGKNSTEVFVQVYITTNIIHMYKYSRIIINAN